MVGFLFSFVLSFYFFLWSPGFFLSLSFLLQWPAWAVSQVTPPGRPAPSACLQHAQEGQAQACRLGWCLLRRMGTGAGKGLWKKIKLKKKDEVFGSFYPLGSWKAAVSLGMSSCWPVEDLGLPRTEVLPAARLPPLQGACLQRPRPEASEEPPRGPELVCQRGFLQSGLHN